MRDPIILLVHLIVTLARLMGPGGLRSVVAESILVKHQLLILNRSLAPQGETGNDLQVGTAEFLFAAPYVFSLDDREWDVSPDGQRLLMIKLSAVMTSSANGKLGITLVQNWFEELKRLVPTN